MRADTMDGDGDGDSSGSGGGDCEDEDVDNSIHSIMDNLVIVLGVVRGLNRMDPGSQSCRRRCGDSRCSWCWP